MTSQMNAVTFDAQHAADLATFWAAVVGGEVAEGANEQWAQVHSQRAPMLLFLQVPEPKTAKNRCHVDLTTDDVEAEVARLVGLGAETVHSKDEWGVRWTTLRDPQGNEFCVAVHL
jgi:predicted enzyme related to lactoylglutathione lyase